MGINYNLSHAATHHPQHMWCTRRTMQLLTHNTTTQTPTFRHNAINKWQTSASLCNMLSPLCHWHITNHTQHRCAMHNTLTTTLLYNNTQCTMCCYCMMCVCIGCWFETDWTYWSVWMSIPLRSINRSNIAKQMHSQLCQSQCDIEVHQGLVGVVNLVGKLTTCQPCWWVWAILDPHLVTPHACTPVCWINARRDAHHLDVCCQHYPDVYVK